MNSINASYTVYNNCLPIFKQKEICDIATTNTIPQNVNMNGIDALASYNSTTVNTKYQNFNIPTLTRIPVPDDISKIDGEKIYSPEGKLTSVSTINSND